MQRSLFLTFAVLAALGTRGLASTLTYDELGNGTTGAGVLAPDPGPGGLPAVLTYSLGFAVVPGDVLLLDGPNVLDVVRFNEPPTGGPGTLVFYSDNTDGVDALADTPSPPGGFYSNLVRIPEVGPEGNNGAFYTPGPNDPGFVAGATPVTYHLISDSSPVPLPSTAGAGLVLLVGCGGIKLARWQFALHR